MSVPRACLCAWLCLLAPAVAGAEGTDGSRNVGCMVYNNGLHFTEAELERLEQAPEIQYVGVQMGGPSGHDRAVAARLAAAGKRIVLQIWWGADPPHSWSRFSMANIALDREQREAFFGAVVDPLIDSIGPEHIHAAHMLEETGACFATDMLEPGDPENLADGSGGTYDSPFYTGYDRRDAYGGPWMLSLRRHNADFRRFSGFDLFAASLWEPPGSIYHPGTPQYRALRRWVGRRVQALANIRFAEHLHAKYPTILATTWDGPNFGGNVWADTPAMMDALDGFTANAYADPLRTYVFARTLRVLDFDKELQFMSWVGRDNLDRNQRAAMLTSIYVVGSNMIHLWEEPQRCYSRDDLWAISRRFYGTFSRLPVFRRRPEVFVICGGWSIPSRYLMDFDAAHHEDAEGVGLGRYRLVLADGAGHPGLARYVADGGLLVAFGRRPAFIDPAGDDAPAGAEADVGQAVPVAHGAGHVLWLARRATGDGTEDAWQQFVHDRVGAFAAARGLQETFARHFAPRDSGGGYLKITSDDGAVTCYLHHRVGPAGPAVRVAGVDVLTGDRDPVLGPQRSAAIVAHRPPVDWAPPQARAESARRVKPAEPGARRGLQEVPEPGPVPSLGPAARALEAAAPPRRVTGPFDDWAAPGTRFRLAMRFAAAGDGPIAQPVVLSGAALYAVTGLGEMSWGSVRLFVDGLERPVQVDERDRTGRLLASGNQRLDTDDELVFAVSTGDLCHLYYDSDGDRAPPRTWADADVRFERVETATADATLGSRRFVAHLKGPARYPGEHRIENHGAGAITQLMLDGRGFTRMREQWNNVFLESPFAGDGGWEEPRVVRHGPLRCIVSTRLPHVTRRNDAGQVTFDGAVTHQFALYGTQPVLDVEQRVSYAWSQRKWSAGCFFHATVGARLDDGDVLLVPVAGAPRRAPMAGWAHERRYLEHRPEAGWMALLDERERHGCALFYASMDEVRENLAWVDYAPRRELTPAVTIGPHGYRMDVGYTNRVMQTGDTIVRRFRIVGLTDENERIVAGQYRLWGETLTRVAEVEVHTQVRAGAP